MHQRLNRPLALKSFKENNMTLSTKFPGLASALDIAARYGLYIALFIVFLWFGGMKFTAYEAGAIKGLIANSPFMSWLLPAFGEQGASNLIGIIEIIVAVLLAGRLFSPKLSALGALGAIGTFALTLTFFFSTPGVFLTDVGGPAISVVPGQFLLKDLVLLAASLWALNESLTADKS